MSYTCIEYEYKKNISGYGICMLHGIRIVYRDRKGEIVKVKKSVVMGNIFTVIDL